MDAVNGDLHDAASYGALLADEYDAIYEGVFDTDGAVDRLADAIWLIWRMAAGSSIRRGYGPIALPLAERGLDVWGIDGSAEMLELLGIVAWRRQSRARCAGTSPPKADGEFDLVVLLVNTIYAMHTQEDQISCFANAARHLAPGGRFVVEAWVPDPPRGDGLGLKARRLGRGYAGLVIEDHDAGRQTRRRRRSSSMRTGARGAFHWSTATRGLPNSTSWRASTE